MLSLLLTRLHRLRNLFADLEQIARYHPILCLIRIVAMAMDMAHMERHTTLVADAIPDVAN